MNKEYVEPKTNIFGGNGLGMTSRESLKWQYICAACGVSFEVLYSIFWGGFGHNIPPGAAANLSAHDLGRFLHSEPLFDPFR